MTVDELIEWLESAKEYSPGREIGAFYIHIGSTELDADEINVDVAIGEVILRP